MDRFILHSPSRIFYVLFCINCLCCICQSDCQLIKAIALDGYQYATFSNEVFGSYAASVATKFGTIESFILSSFYQDVP